ncbi:MAG: hypothetical protein FWD64_07080, partial [Acidobacteriaceae bacterium]|nr:hypothetical protein [Acidobacteriaceae bacterium]
PQHRNIVFAGTTEGLYRTSDEGKNWRLMTGPELTVNDVYIDPGDSNRVLLATDRSGVLASNDGGFTFSPSNDGFTSRQITSFVVDARRPADLYVGVVNDKAWGGVFTSGNGGVSWSQQSQGLDSRDVKSLEQASDGTLLAGTDHGIYRLADGVWSKTDIARAQPKPVVRKPVVKPASSHRAPVVRKASLKKAPVMKAPEKKEPEKAAEAKPSGFDGAVYAMTRVGDAVYAATSEGVLRSGSAGMSWEELRPLAGQEWRFIAAHRSRIFAASLHTAVVSGDGGESWEPVDLPGELTQVAAIAVDGEGSLWVGGGEGVFYSEDDGATWQRPPHFTVYDVNSLYYDEAGQRVLVTANNRNTNVYAIQSQAKTVKLWDSGWHLRMVRPVGDYLVGATLFDGIVVQPRMVASPFQDAH